MANALYEHLPIAEADSLSSLLAGFWFGIAAGCLTAGWISDTASIRLGPWGCWGMAAGLMLRRWLAGSGPSEPGAKPILSMSIVTIGTRILLVGWARGRGFTGPLQVFLHRAPPPTRGRGSAP